MRELQVNEVASVAGGGLLTFAAAALAQRVGYVGIYSAVRGLENMFVGVDKYIQAGYTSELVGEVFAVSYGAAGIAKGFLESFGKSTTTLAADIDTILSKLHIVF